MLAPLGAASPSRARCKRPRSRERKRVHAEVAHRGAKTRIGPYRVEERVAAKPAGLVPAALTALGHQQPHEWLAIAEDEFRERGVSAAGAVAPRSAELRANAFRVRPAAGRSVREEQWRAPSGAVRVQLHPALEGTHCAVRLPAEHLCEPQAGNGER